MEVPENSKETKNVPQTGAHTHVCVHAHARTHTHTHTPPHTLHNINQLDNEITAGQSAN